MNILLATYQSIFFSIKIGDTVLEKGYPDENYSTYSSEFTYIIQASLKSSGEQFQVQRHRPQILSFPANYFKGPNLVP